uniref:Uncharacterized protein n=1 Tax=Kalanchoe fedtschenkoi TaxID=63787 RepID=A0A7N0TLD5_KALFE
MTSLNSIGLGLSLTFGCLLLALVGEIYYLLWWKRSWNRGGSTAEDECCSSTSSSAREFMYMFCCKKPSDTQPLGTTASLTDRFQRHNDNSSSNNELVVKSCGVGSDEELAGFHDSHISGPPGILFTIKEETREELESEDGRLSERSSSDLMVHSVEIETPYLTPVSSPSMFITPPLTPTSAYTHLGFNPLFETSSEAELRILKASSPPPKFKFLQEAEDKFRQRRRMMEEADEDHFNNECEGGENPHPERCKREESFITIIVAKGGRGHRG